MAIPAIDYLRTSPVGARLRSVLQRLGELHEAMEHLREAEALAEVLNDDHRRGLVWAAESNAYAALGEPEEAVRRGSRALEMAGKLRDVRLQITSRSRLEHAHYFKGDYERVVELATHNLTALAGLSTSPLDSPRQRSWTARGSSGA
jgi:tetratricopeptide (TPR) repeat protein